MVTRGTEVRIVNVWIEFWIWIETMKVAREMSGVVIIHNYLIVSFEISRYQLVQYEFKYNYCIILANNRFRVESGRQQ